MQRIEGKVGRWYEIKDGYASNKPQIVVDWHRLDSGVFSGKEGDIYKTVSCEKLSVDKDIKPLSKKNVITFDDKFYTCVEFVHKCFGSHANLYELVEESEYSQTPELQSHYIGTRIKFNGNLYRLDFPIDVIESEKTLAEMVHLIREMYANGGSFAATQTYTEFLKGADDNKGTIWELEQFHAQAELSREIIKQMLDDGEMPSVDGGKVIKEEG